MNVVAQAQVSVGTGVQDESKAVISERDGDYQPASKTDKITLILRDLPSNTTKENVLELLSIGADGSPVSAPPSILSCEEGGNNSWFIAFQSEAEAREWHEIFKTRQFQDKPLHARLKIESSSRPAYNEGANVMAQPVSSGTQPDFHAGVGMPYPAMPIHQPYVFMSGFMPGYMPMQQYGVPMIAVPDQGMLNWPMPGMMPMMPYPVPPAMASVPMMAANGGQYNNYRGNNHNQVNRQYTQRPRQQNGYRNGDGYQSNQGFNNNNQGNNYNRNGNYGNYNRSYQNRTTNSSAAHDSQGGQSQNDTEGHAKSFESPPVVGAESKPQEPNDQSNNNNSQPITNIDGARSKVADVQGNTRGHNSRGDLAGKTGAFKQGENAHRARVPRENNGVKDNNGKKRNSGSANTVKPKPPTPQFNMELDFPTLTSEAANESVGSSKPSISQGYAAVLKGDAVVTSKDESDSERKNNSREVGGKAKGKHQSANGKTKSEPADRKEYLREHKLDEVVEFAPFPNNADSTANLVENIEVKDSAVEKSSASSFEVVEELPKIVFGEFVATVEDSGVRKSQFGGDEILRESLGVDQGVAVGCSDSQSGPWGTKKSFLDVVRTKK